MPRVAWSLPRAACRVRGEQEPEALGGSPYS